MLSTPPKQKLSITRVSYLAPFNVPTIGSFINILPLNDFFGMFDLNATNDGLITREAGRYLFEFELFDTIQVSGGGAPRLQFDLLNGDVFSEPSIFTLPLIATAAPTAQVSSFSVKAFVVLFEGNVVSPRVNQLVQVSSLAFQIFFKITKYD